MRVSSTNLSIHAFADTDDFGRKLARLVHAPFSLIARRTFPDGESLVRVIGKPSRGAVLVRSLHDPNAKFVELMLAADALRRAGTRKITLVAPYLGYMRQDTVFQPGEPISQRVIGEWLGHTFDRVLTLEAHLHRTKALADVFPGCQAVSIPSAPILAAWLGKGKTSTLLVGPDEESEPWVRSIGRLSGLSWVVGRKKRQGDTQVRIDLPHGIEAKRAVIIDDIASSGGTIATTARALRKLGVRWIDVAVVHAIFAPRALYRIRQAGVRHVVSCNTIPHPTNAISCIPLFAEKL